MKTRLLLLFLLLIVLFYVVSNPPTDKFVVPGGWERNAALGGADSAVYATGNGFFDVIKTPGPMDWLSLHPESGQTYDQFVSEGIPTPTDNKKTIYLQPIGKFTVDSPSLESLRYFTSVFFGLPVVMLPESNPSKLVRHRKNPHSQQLQWNSTDLIRTLCDQLPDDGFCIAGMTMTDLYPSEKWNFVFGQASLRFHTGIYSFARYMPTFGGKKRKNPELMLRRSYKVMAHEIGHIFGLHHCIYWSCLMNGSNHLKESDESPMHLCPICLRKLQHSCKFDPVQRYSLLQKIFEKDGLKTDSVWLKRRMQWIVKQSTN
jgi:archaemetzincin